MSICDGVLDVGEEVMFCVGRPRAAMSMDRYEYMQMKRGIADAQRKRAEKTLRAKKIAKIEKKAGEVAVLFSEKGKTELLKYAITQRIKRLPDGYHCLVSFDIPEAAAGTRKLFRDFLKTVGFRQLHRSVWVSEMDIVELMRVLVKRLEIDSWVSIFEARD